MIRFERTALEVAGVEVLPTLRTLCITIARHDLDSPVAAVGRPIMKARSASITIGVLADDECE